VEELEPTGDRELDELVEAASVNLVVEWAELSGLVAVDGRDLNVARLGAQLSGNPLAFWQAAREARLDLGVVDLDDNGPSWGQTIDSAMADLVVLAHLRDSPIPVGELVEMLWDGEEEV